MRRYAGLSVALGIGLFGGCSRQAKVSETPPSPRAEHGSDSPLVRIAIDAEGNHYLVDPTTQLCFLALHDKPPVEIACERLHKVEAARPHLPWVVPPFVEPEPASVQDASASSAARAEDPELEALLAGITEVRPGEFEIPRDLLDQVLQDPAKIVSSARMIPSIKDGRPEGIKLYAIRQRSFFNRLGLQNGDTVLSLNGHTLAPIDKIFEAADSLRGADTAVMEISRRSQPITLRYTIVAPRP